MKWKVMLVAIIAAVALAPPTAAASVTQNQFQRLADKVERQKARITTLKVRVVRLERRHNNLVDVHNALQAWTTDGFTLVNDALSDLSTRFTGISGAVRALGDLVLCHINQPAHGGAC